MVKTGMIALQIASMLHSWRPWWIPCLRIRETLFDWPFSKV